MTNPTTRSKRECGLLAIALAGGAMWWAWALLPGPLPAPARAQDPAPTITPTLPVTPPATTTPPPTPPWVNIRTDGPMRVQLCSGLAPVEPTPGALPPLAGCIDVAPYGGAPTASAPGQWYILWPGAFVYRLVPEPAPWPGWCEPQVITATPIPTDTPTATITPNAVATFVVGTLTALAPTATGTPTPMPEATPTRPSLMLFPVLQRLPPASAARRRR